MNSENQNQQEIQQLVARGRQAEGEGDLHRARHHFLEAAQIALELASKETNSQTKKNLMDRALSLKEEARKFSAEIEKPAEDHLPSESAPKEETPSPETEEVSPPDVDEDLPPQDDYSPKTAKKWKELGERAEEKEDRKKARKHYLKAAEVYYVMAQEEGVRAYLQEGRSLKERAEDMGRDLPPHVEDWRREAREEEEMARVSKDEGDFKAARIHFLKATEKLLKLADCKEVPGRERYLNWAHELKGEADSLQKGEGPSTSEARDTGDKDGGAQPMRAEFLLRRAEEYERKGLDARDTGNKKRAVFYLGKAAEMLRQLADVSSEKLQEARIERAERLEKIVSRLDGGGSSSREKQAAKDSGEDEKVFIPVEKPNIYFKDIAGLHEVKEEVRRKMILPFQYPEEAEKFGVKKGGGILLYGPPGTGKTMIGQAIAAEIEAAFFTVRPSEIMSKWVGEAEKNINLLFETARKQDRSVIFIDEIESLVPSRRDNQSNVMQRLVPQILAELEGFGTQEKNPLLFLGATNEPWSLDPAVLRPGRFDDKIYVSLPDHPAVYRMLEMYLGEKPLDEDVDFEEIAEYMVEKKYSGADVKNVCIKASTDAFVTAIEEGNADEALITMNHVLRVIQRTRSSITPQDLERFENYARTH